MSVSVLLTAEGSRMAPGLPVDVMAHARDESGQEHERFPVWRFFTRDAAHVTVGPAITLRCRQETNFIIIKLFQSKTADREKLSPVCVPSVPQPEVWGKFKLWLQQLLAAHAYTQTNREWLTMMFWWGEKSTSKFHYFPGSHPEVCGTDWNQRSWGGPEPRRCSRVRKGGGGGVSGGLPPHSAGWQTAKSDTDSLTFTACGLWLHVFMRRTTKTYLHADSLDGQQEGIEWMKAGDLHELLFLLVWYARLDSLQQGMGLQRKGGGVHT